MTACESRLCYWTSHCVRKSFDPFGDGLHVAKAPRTAGDQLWWWEPGDVWKSWYRSWTFYKTAKEFSEKSGAIQCATFLHVAGPAAQHVYASWTIATKDKDDIAKLEDKFARHGSPFNNITVNRYRSNSCSQRETEIFSTYLTVLRDLLKHCEYGDLESDLLRDKIVCGIRDKIVREHLLRTPDLKLKGATDICVAAEESVGLMRTLHISSPAAEVDVVKQSRVTAQAGAQPGSALNMRMSSFSGHRSSTSTSEFVHCQFCMYKHPKRKCPAFNKLCYRCGQHNHFEKSPKCPMFNPQGTSCTKGQSVRHRIENKHLVHQVTDILVQDSQDEDLDLYDVAEFSGTIYTEQPSGLDEFYIDSVDFSSKMTVADWCEPGKVNNQNNVFKLDSGAQINVIPEGFVDVNACHMTKPRTMLKSYTGHVIENIGCAD